MAAPLRASSTSPRPKTWPAARSQRAPAPPQPKAPTSHLQHSSAASGPDTSWSWRTLKTTTTHWTVRFNIFKCLPALSVFVRVLKKRSGLWLDGSSNFRRKDNKTQPSYTNSYIGWFTINCLLNYWYSALMYILCILFISYYCMSKWNDQSEMWQQEACWIWPKQNKCSGAMQWKGQSVCIAQFYGLCRSFHEVYFNSELSNNVFRENQC